MWLSLLVLWAGAADERPATAQTRSGPPIKQIERKGKIGASIAYEELREIYDQSRDLAQRRHPFAGSDYVAHPYRAAVMQGQAVFHYRERPLWLVHNFFCWQMAGTAEMPWSCESTVYVLKGGHPVTDRPPSERPGSATENGFTLLDPEDSAEVSGDFDAIEPHPGQPLFAAIQRGCCGSESRVSIHDFEGRTLCAPSNLLIGWNDSVGTWDKVRIEKGQVYCPDGTRASIEATAAARPERPIRKPRVRGSAHESRLSRRQGR
jgi:hypothetical protein